MNTASTLYQNIGFILNSSNIDKKSKEKALKLKQDFERNQEISKSDEKWVFKMYRKLKNI